MLTVAFHIALLILFVYLFLSTQYLAFLALIFFVVKRGPDDSDAPQRSYLILVPAHNEELLISNVCESLLNIDYPARLYRTVVIADNCTDNTAAISRNICGVETFVRVDPDHIGKGHAINWALQRIDLKQHDAVLIIDADNIVDSQILTALNQNLAKGEMAVQCYNTVENRNDSWFTQLLFVSRTIGNLFYHQSKYILGLSSYLMGNGICFSTDLLLERGWDAFSIGEDWEYYAHLIYNDIKIGYAVNARVYHQESKSLKQATSQRLRWSYGRFKVLKVLGLKMLLKGLKNRNILLIDASLPLIFPNYSLQVNLNLLCILLAFLLPSSFYKILILSTSVAMLFILVSIFLAGTFYVGQVIEVFKSMLFAPAFLVWKLIIDLLSFSGFYSGRTWVRTSRHKRN